MNRKLGALEVVLMLGAAGLAYAAIASGHEDWVETAVPVCLVAGFLVEPLLVFAHELGHAAAAVALTHRRTRVQMGEQPFLLRFAIGRIDVDYAPGGYVAHCELDPSTAITPRRLLVIAVAGPAVSVVLGLALGWAAAGQQHGPRVLFWILVLAAGSSLLLGVANAVPFRRLPAWWPGAMRQEDHLSDGYLALLALRRDVPPASVGALPRPSQAMTERARRIVAAAGAAAQAQDRTYVGTEHLLLGLLDQQDGVAALVLRDCGLLRTDVLADLERGNGLHPNCSPRDHELTPAAKRVLYRAWDTLTLRGDQQIDSEHILLGLIQEPEASGTQVMSNCGVDATQVRQAILTALHQGTS